MRIGTELAEATTLLLKALIILKTFYTCWTDYLNLITSLIQSLLMVFFIVSQTPNPISPVTLLSALDVIFILHAEHEINCSTAAMRQMASTGIDPFICLSGAASALYGPSHGGANEAALKMLEEIGSVDRIPEFIEQVKQKKRRLMGFGN